MFFAWLDGHDMTIIEADGVSKSGLPALSLALMVPAFEDGHQALRGGPFGLGCRPALLGTGDCQKRHYFQLRVPSP